MDLEKDPSAFDAAHAEARRMIAQIDDGKGEVNGYPVSPADIAAVIIARAARSVKNPAAKINKMQSHAVRIINELKPLTQNIIPDGHAQGRNIVGWTLARSHLFVGSIMFQMSAAVPGLHLTLPEVEADDDALTSVFRRHLSQMGIKPELTAAASAVTRRTNHEQWTRYEVPMPDERLTAHGEILNAPHLSPQTIDESLRTYAKAALDIYENHASLSRLADQVQRDAENQTIGVSGFEIGKVRLYSVSAYSSLTMGQNVTFHVPVRTLNAALRPVDKRVAYVSMLGFGQITSAQMHETIKVHNLRLNKIDQHGGVRIDQTGIEILTSLGHDAEQMIASAREASHHTVQRGSDTYLSIEEGKIRVVAPLSDTVRWNKDHVDMPGVLPETVMQVLAGRPARSVVDHPALEGAIVSRAKRKGKRTLIYMQPRWEVRP